ncbi:MAG TPA: TolC family protein [Bryobacteraceae bacterium]|jgi:outer membrane protein TolC|nr:TolC family protein [Bryobacteraceae bacterium]
MTRRLLLILACTTAFAQQGFLRPSGFVRAYEAPSVPPVNFQNSQRIFDLLRAGQIYLSLQDAIALALENNLDIELGRFLPKVADTDVLRAQGGGLLRGLNLLVNETAPGIGGPSGPLLTNLTAGSTPSALVNTNFSDIALISQQQNNLSVTDPIAMANGPALPQFDPIFSAQVNTEHATTPEYSSILTGSNWLAENNLNANTGLNVGFSSGTQLSANFNNSRYSTDATRYTYNPFVSSSIGFTITQPLLQGFGASLNRRFIRIARNNRNVADLVFRQQVIDTVAGVTRLYTDLVSLNEDVKVKQESLRLAERLYEDNRNQVTQGTQAPIEVTRANAALAASRQALITAQGLVRQQELIVLTALTRGGLANPELLAAHIMPTDSLLVPERETDQPLEGLVRTAIQKRPDLAGAGLQVENTEISLKGSLNALKPQLDLVGTAQNSGLAGDQNSLAASSSPGLAVGGYGSALGQVFRRNYPTYAVGVQLTVPLRNRVAQADAVRDELQVRQAQVRRQQLEDQVRLEVADAEENLRQARAAYEAAVEASHLQEQSVTVEQQTFDVGLSTNLQLIQYQTYLAQARSTEVASRAAYVKAQIALERALGTILEDHQVTIDQAYRGAK